VLLVGSEVAAGDHFLAKLEIAGTSSGSTSIPRN